MGGDTGGEREGKEEAEEKGDRGCSIVNLLAIDGLLEETSRGRAKFTCLHTHRALPHQTPDSA